MSAEDPLSILNCSSTFLGLWIHQKGIVHAAGRCLLRAALTVKYAFVVHPEDRFACMTDVGWSLVTRPLLDGVTATVLESTPVYPTPSRHWQVVEKHKITQFYTAPTAIRLLRCLGERHTQDDLSTVRVLGSVSEPIDPEACLGLV
ncbi:hypothetical protein BJ322DRAFT_1109019 [Thelephora terrestris]|uniref:acetate--CoA ligase n=1 Tax=Thelephora terrestris TaxID=56493 RepID=A0A9P6H3V0_9AGAM|nr:hypothetical protein BJ322DRAFT_1184313 [Thelephora terrestris]KAF9783562.1 hypothetical protein BJ322DRAFT_1110460 [Thelephora terrestris]KAF9784294.1 hypothetical protein BJ322DRAFT_1109019 [Thelephora terrestris]